MWSHHDSLGKSHVDCAACRPAARTSVFRPSITICNGSPGNWDADLSTGFARARGKAGGKHQPCQKFICHLCRAYQDAWAADGDASLPVAGLNANLAGITRSPGTFVPLTPGRGHRPFPTPFRKFRQLIAKQSCCQSFPPHLTSADEQTQNIANVPGCSSAWSAGDQ